ncbi:MULTISPECIES: HNH endonuclease [unclassified Pseudomonas]|uniref:HNH endonuclease n=1 Tax=unclassified Pseudomonas TaxID=196821 RepID=UPI000C880315|nr:MULTISPECIES: HNH endonuclease [unclassified Pseudomonas]PMZ92739.1 hypothetical protein C1X61_02355 [Pseudomonas sp. FW215-T2]PNA16689.1 hypothetical protein C1X62_00970 [Pseudomonas sp. FW215-R3]PNB39592.1 hypothetical protein C1X63_01430 [Pseudomonas sp. FW305-131]
MGNLTSDRLKPDAIYSRNDLKQLFDIKDATLKNGIFQPKGYDSVWLFLTEEKPREQTQYVDTLTGDVLGMQGQKERRTDHLILEHKERGLELLVFYRRNKLEYPAYGFRYQGAFFYESHSNLDSKATSFILRREGTESVDTSLKEIERKEDALGAFDPSDSKDARERTLTSIVRRRGQTRFRKILLRAYEGRCAVTKCEIEPILEAAHIHPYLGDQTDVVSNGLLLRADIHTLFDFGMLWIEPESLAIRISDRLKYSEYSSLEGQLLILPKNVSDHPSQAALTFRKNLN